jgi:hypothetical protein
MTTAPAAFVKTPDLSRLLWAFFIFFLCTAAGAMADPASDEIILHEVRMEQLPFRKAFSTVNALLAAKHLKAEIDPVHDIPENFDSPRTFTFLRNEVPLSHLLKCFCRYYGLECKRSGDTVVFSLPRPRPQPTSGAR